MQEYFISGNSNKSQVIEEYDKIFNSLNIGVFEYKTDKKAMKFLKVNQFGCELFHFENPASFLAYDWTLAEVCHPDEVEYLFEEMGRMNEIGDLVEHEYRLNRHNGTYIWVLCHQKVIDKEGKWLTILNSCTVINEKKWAEEANAAKTAFLSNMSHDMRTPLNAILNVSVLAKDNLEQPEKLLNDLGEIEVAGRYLLSLVNDVLDMNKIENRELKFTPCVYYWKEFAEYVDSIIKPLCKQRNITFIWEKNQGEGHPIWVDKTRFNQIFFNLLSNAAKYTLPGGKVTFSSQRSEIVDGIITCEYVIEDTGIGMSNDFQSRMFEPFEREERSSAYAGTGLGLTIVKEIIDAMEGEIRIESKRGFGTKVVVYLSMPIATTEQIAFSNVNREWLKNQSYRSSKEKKHLLIVEDNVINRRILSRILEKEGYTFDQVVNGLEAVEVISNCKPDHYQGILMDIRMPEMDGLMATRRIRDLESEYAKRVPIIAMTANAYEEDINASISAGMNAHLAKPVEPELLFRTLERFL